MNDYDNLDSTQKDDALNLACSSSNISILFAIHFVILTSMLVSVHERTLWEFMFVIIEIEEIVYFLDHDLSGSIKNVARSQCTTQLSRAVIAHVSTISACRPI